MTDKSKNELAHLQTSELLHDVKTLVEQGRNQAVAAASDRNLGVRNLRRGISVCGGLFEFRDCVTTGVTMKIVVPLARQLSWIHLLEEKLHNALIEVRERLAERRFLEGGIGNCRHDR